MVPRIMLYLVYPRWSFRYLLGSNAGPCQWVSEHEGRPWGKFQSPVWIQIEPRNTDQLQLPLAFFVWAHGPQYQAGLGTRRILIPLRHLLTINFLRMWHVSSASGSVFRHGTATCNPPLSESFPFTEVHPIRISIRGSRNCPVKAGIQLNSWMTNTCLTDLGKTSWFLMQPQNYRGKLKILGYFIPKNLPYLRQCRKYPKNKRFLYSLALCLLQSGTSLPS